VFNESSFRFYGADKVTKSSEFGAVPENFNMANVACQGNESSIRNCSHSGEADCNSYDGAGVVCLDTLGLGEFRIKSLPLNINDDIPYPSFFNFLCIPPEKNSHCKIIGYTISLMGGKAAHRGHVFTGNFPVCSDGWDLRDATVACRMLGWEQFMPQYLHTK
jgi:hypothetical protein